jgi:hypothetical protein
MRKSREGGSIIYDECCKGKNKVGIGEEGKEEID